MADNNQKKDPNDQNFFNKNPLLTFAIFSLLIIILFKSFVGTQEGQFGAQNPNAMGTAPVTQTKTIPYSDLKRMIKEGKIKYVSIGQTTIKAISSEGGFKTLYIAKKVGEDSTLIPLLDQKGVEYSGYSENNWLGEILFGWVLPILIFFGIWMFLASRMQKNMGGGILGMGSAKKLVNSEKPNVKFDDVAGVEEAKEEVKEIVEFLKYPERYIRLGAKIPKGVLLVGPPGTGKTLLAKAVAGEANVPFFSVSGSSFIEMFVGVGAARVRDLFEQAKKEAPAIIFIDEIDAIGKSRAASGQIGGNDEREQTLNQLLAEMDGFSSDTPIIVLAATNRPEVLDPALLRPGRFDRQVLVDKPDFEGRVKILKVHVKHIKMAPNVDLEEIARLTAGLAGADLANIVNEAALLAGRQNKEQVEQEDFLEAVERAIAGLEKKSRRIAPKEKRIVAYHESGHALIAETTPGAKKVSKVSIIPRGLAALGYTLNTPEENKYLMQKHELVAEIDTLLGGRAAEEVFIKEISTGASNDLERATDIVKAMVSLYGMSDVAGLMVLEKQTNMFLGGGYSQKEYSEKTAEEMDEFIKNFLNERYKHVVSRLKEYSEAIEEMVEELFKAETIEGEKVRQIIREFEKRHGIKSKLVGEESEESVDKTSAEKGADTEKEEK
ncbi:ATP-dependent zinc metalloprotease FtsH [Hydrogenimonas sp.]|uniref:ATP-dependent zinc metalloprotease FtsH n=1 Tax=Hydrogenimonas sp. TaxID=2231112 RepID=UPI00261484F4|nr:ATP-dependent zinc metalloprotease FtsH [Hydrogenimonas sp.]